jgi:outer membrane protein assembly factor BamE
MAAIAAALAGCSSGKWGFPYKAPVQQGNWITSEQVALLRPGMTREQVRFVLGSPTLTSVLHADRWDYPYYFKPGYGSPQERKFTVWFQDDKVVRWQGDKQPDVQPFQHETAQAKAAAEAQAQLDAEAAGQSKPAPAPAAPGTGQTSPSAGGLPAGVTSATPPDAPAAASVNSSAPAKQ